MRLRGTRRIDGALRGRCVAVVDIGSNSLRLVIFDGVRRSPRTLFNEKAMCGLGRNLEATGRLDPDGVALARTNLQRFVTLARNIGVKRLDVLATAAVRDASDGRAFVAEVERRHRLDVKVLSGAEEGRLSAYGVLAGIPGANGIVGDLGGGSAELVPVAGGQVGAAATLPIGPLRLAEHGSDDKRLRDVIDKHLATVPWLATKVDGGGAFYAVGGAWRALARIHMEQARYPMHIIQQYTLPRGEAEDFLDVIARQSRKSLEKITTISRKRLDVVPIAARVLHRLLKRIQPKHLVFSAFGLREGHLYSLLGEVEQRADPLIAGCADLAALNRRFGADGEELYAWTAALFAEEKEERRRLRRAAALLSDIAWHEHPDYRADMALRGVLYMPVAGVSHDERAYLAAAVHARYGGDSGADLLRRLLDDEALAAARRSGLALRLGYTLSGGVPGVLARNKLGVENGALVLELSAEGARRFGESVQRRLDALGRSFGKRTEVRGI